MKRTTSKSDMGSQPDQNGRSTLTDSRFHVRSLTSPHRFSSSLPRRMQDSGSSESVSPLLAPPSHLSRRSRNSSSPGTSHSTPSPRQRSPSVESDVQSVASNEELLSDPFRDSSSCSPTVEDRREVSTQTLELRLQFSPSRDFLLYPEDVESDDWLHNPDMRYSQKRSFTSLSLRELLRRLGFILLGVGLFALFIGYPIAALIQKFVDPFADICSEPNKCISHEHPLLKNIRLSLIDSATPESAKTRTGVDGKKQTLVFSDEFEQDGRSFYAGDDPYFQAVDLWYGVTQDLEWYDPDAISTANSTLEIRFDAFQNHGLNYRSGMLQTWNQMCFKGGYIEASVSLPGLGDTIGLWPGIWTMGNLGRPGYPSTTDGMWPYSYWDECDFGITKNQSHTDGLSFLPGMRLPACVCSVDKAEHPSPGKSRTAPELDVLEGSVLFLDPPNRAAIGSASQSAQFAPFDIWYQPNYDYVAVYDNSITSMNNYRGGVYQQAISGVTNLNNSWYDGKEYQKFAFEYTPGATGTVHWYVGDERTWSLDARAIGPNGNIGQRVIPVEPLAVVANLGMSNSFALLNLTGLGPLLPVTMRIDYIRIYQGEEDSVGCDPPGYPTTEYIKQHAKAYSNPQIALWEQTGYTWPKNSFVDDCET